MAVTSDDVAWVRGFRVAEKYGVVDRFADEVRTVQIGRHSGVTHSEFCDAAVDLEKVALPLPEAVQLLDSSVLCDQCLPRWEVWTRSAMPPLLVLDAVVAECAPVSDWFAPETTVLRQHLGHLSERQQVLSRLDGSSLGALWGQVPSRFVEHRDLLRAQVMAQSAVAWAAPLLTVPITRTRWEGDNRWILEEVFAISDAGHNQLILSCDTLVDELSAKDPSPSLVKRLLTDAVLSARSHGVTVPDRYLTSAVDMVDETYAADVVWIAAERHHFADLAMLWPSASAGSLTVLAAPEAVSVGCTSPSQTARCTPVPAPLADPDVGLLQTAAQLASELSGTFGVSSEQWCDVVRTVSALT
jgi:hypothetical protein